MELQTAFYIIAIIYMTAMIIFFAALAIALLAIKAKINHVHNSIDRKVNKVKSITRKTAVGAKALRYYFSRRI